MNIIEFFDTELFNKRSMMLHPMQRLILKLIYGLSLNEQETNLAIQYQLPTDQIDYTQIVGILGRRTGKDFLLSIIAAYEAYNLIEMRTPCTHYQVGTSDPITILAVVGSHQQERVFFMEMYNTIRNAKYFKNRCKSPRQGVITFKTEEGDIEIKVGSAGSNSLLGISYHTLLFSEAAAYRNQNIIAELMPAVARFNGKTVIFTSPQTSDDLVYEMWSTPVSGRLSFAMPTWIVNPTLGEGALRMYNSRMNEAMFRREYGAQFANPPVNIAALAYQEQAEREREENEDTDSPPEKRIITEKTHSYPFGRQLDLGE